MKRTLCTLLTATVFLMFAGCATTQSHDKGCSGRHSGCHEKADCNHGKDKVRHERHHEEQTTETESTRIVIE